MYTYLMMGRISGDDNIVKIINAPCLLSAKIAFTHHLKEVQSWCMGDAVYIETSVELSNAIDESLTVETFDDITKKYHQVLALEHKNKYNLLLVFAYTVTMDCNPYDMANLLNGFNGLTSDEVYSVDEFGDDTTILRDGEVVVETEDSLSTFYYIYHALETNITLTMELYSDTYLLHHAIGDDPKYSEVNIPELKAFPKASV